MKRIVLAMLLLCLFGTAAAQTVKQKVAVYVTGDADSGSKKVIGSKMVSGITRSDSYAAVERTADFLAALTSEQDYQMSGAVSDNQIAKLGQQFGVRYVLVADTSEVFDAMFISARLIDVQTGQITAATEASSVVNSMTGLTDLSGQIVLGLLGPMSGGVAQQDGAVKIIGPLSTYKALYNYKSQIPSGYVIASRVDIDKMIQSYKMIDKTVPYPIYLSIEIEPNGGTKGKWATEHYKIFCQQLLESGAVEKVTYRVTNYTGPKWTENYDMRGFSDRAPAGYICLVKQ